MRQRGGALSKDLEKRFAVARRSFQIELDSVATGAVVASLDALYLTAISVSYDTLVI